MVKNVTHYTQIEYIHEHTHVVSLTHTEDMCAHIQTLKHTRRPDTHQLHPTHIPPQRHTHTHTHTHTGAQTPTHAHTHTHNVTLLYRNVRHKYYSYFFSEELSS